MRERVRAQIVWEGDGDLNRWYAYANRTPFLRGHLLLAADPTESDAFALPNGFQAALQTTLALARQWGERHKSPGCVATFVRMNIAGGQFRLHVFPLSPQEIQGSSALMHERYPSLRGILGGGFYYLGQLEHAADAINAERGGFSWNTTDEYLESSGVAEVVRQYRAIAQQVASGLGP